MASNLGLVAVVDGGAFPLVVDGGLVALAAVPQEVHHGHRDEAPPNHVARPERHVSECDRRQTTTKCSMLFCHLQAVEKAGVEDALEESEVVADLLELEHAPEHEQREEAVVADEDPVREAAVLGRDDAQDDVEHGEGREADREEQIEKLSEPVTLVSHFCLV